MDNFETDNQDKDNLVGESTLDKLTKARQRLKWLGVRNTAGLNSAEMHILNKDYEIAAQSVCSLEMSYRVEMLDVNTDSKVMSDAVDITQENLRLIDEVRELKYEIKGWKKANSILANSRDRWEAACKQLDSELTSIRGES